MLVWGTTQAFAVLLSCFLSCFGSWLLSCFGSSKLQSELELLLSEHLLLPRLGTFPSIILSQGAELWKTCFFVVTGAFGAQSVAFIWFGLAEKEFPLHTVQGGQIGLDIQSLAFPHVGQICCRKEITYFKSSQVLKTSSQDFKTFSLQPKLILLAISTLFLLGIIYFYNSAKKKTKSHKIPRHRQTLITLKEHSILLAIFLVVLLFEESVAGFIEINYTELGPSGAFWVWWTQVFLGYSVTSIVLPALCLRFVKLFYRRSSVWFASINALAINQYTLPGAV